MSKDMIGMSKLEQHFYLLLAAHNIKGFIFNFEFHPTRKWKIDFCNPQTKVAVEIEGLVYKPEKKSRHTTNTGYKGDVEKYNEISKAGYYLLRYCDKAQMRSFKDDYTTILTKTANNV